MSRTQFKTLKVSWATDRTPFTIVSLNRPKQKNAINQTMYLEISQALKEVGEDGRSKGMILTGAGDYYSSGNDLSNFSQVMHPKTMAKACRDLCYSFVDSFVEFEKPLIVACNGPAIGIATTTMGLCDVRICTPNATFNTPFKRLAQAPEGCSSYMFPRLLGEKAAFDLLDGGVTLNAEEALKVNLVSEIVQKKNDDQSYTAAVIDRALEIADAGVHANLPTLKRFTLEEEGLITKLKDVNKNEVDILEKKWISAECFDAIEDYLRSRNKSTPANVIKLVNATRFLWDR